MNSPLDGVRVLDLTQVMAGPFCTMQLGDLGADVLKVEPPGTGDLSRSMGGTAMQTAADGNAPFLALNRNKRSIVLDLKREDDRATCLALAKTVDVLVENFRPGVAARLGLDYASLAVVNPRLVYASISGFGQAGPYADRPGFDLIAQGMTGLMSVTGEPGGTPVKCGIPIADLSAGLFAVTGILAALLARAQTGQGQYLETSLFEASLALSVWETTEYWATGKAPAAMGSAHRLNAPYQAFRTADGYLNVAALTPVQWRSLCTVLDRPSLADDPRYRDNAARLAHRGALAADIEQALGGETTAYWVERLIDAGVPAGPILDLEQALADAHTHARQMVEYVEHPVAGRVRTLGFPVKFSGTPMRVRRPPPQLGEHSRDIRQEAGLEEA